MRNGGLISLTPTIKHFKQVSFFVELHFIKILPQAEAIPLLSFKKSSSKETGETMQVYTVLKEAYEVVRLDLNDDK